MMGYFRPLFAHGNKDVDDAHLVFQAITGRSGYTIARLTHHALMH